MDNYREKLKMQNWIFAAGSVILAVFSVLGFAAEAGLVPLTPIAGDSHWQSQWRGFISGASFGILAFLLFGFIRNIFALRDEKKLKKLYIKEHDERQIQIWTSARAAATQAFLLLGLVAVIIAGYFNATVSMTILICVLINSSLGLWFKIYYNKKF